MIASFLSLLKHIRYISMDLDWVDGPELPKVFNVTEFWEQRWTTYILYIFWNYDGNTHGFLCKNAIPQISWFIIFISPTGEQPFEINPTMFRWIGGKIDRKAHIPCFHIVSCRFSLEPIHWMFGSSPSRRQAVAVSYRTCISTLEMRTSLIHRKFSGEYNYIYIYIL